MSEILVGVAVRPSVLQVGLFKVLEDADGTRPVELLEEMTGEGRDLPALGGSPCSLAIVDMLGEDWAGMLARLERAGLPPNKVLVVQTVRSVSEAADLLALNVAGCVGASEAPESLMEKVQAVAEGDWRRSRSDLFKAVRKVLEARPLELPLSPGESETISLLARGYSNKRIAERLHLAEGTVRNRVSALYERICVKSRGEAILWAWQHGLGPKDEHADNS